MFVLNVETQCLKFVKGHDKSVKILTVHFIGVCGTMLLIQKTPILFSPINSSLKTFLL